MLHFPVDTMLSPSGSSSGQALLTVFDSWTNWTVPEGVTSISFCVMTNGGSGNWFIGTEEGNFFDWYVVGGHSGSLSWLNNHPVTPGQVISYFVQGPFGSYAGWAGIRLGANGTGTELFSVYATHYTGTLHMHRPGSPGAYTDQWNVGAAQADGAWAPTFSDPSMTGGYSGIAGATFNPMTGTRYFSTSTEINNNGMGAGGGANIGTYQAGLGGYGAIYAIWGEGRTFPTGYAPV